MNNYSFIHRNWRSVFTALIFSWDVGTLFVCGLSTWYLLSRFYTGPILLIGEALPLLGYFGAIHIFFAMLIGLYRQASYVNMGQQFLLASKAYVYATAAILASFYVFHFISVPRSFTILYLILLPFHFAVERIILAAVNRRLQRKGVGIHNALIVSDGGGTLDLYNQFRWFPELGYNIKGFVSSQLTADAAADVSINGIPAYPRSQLRAVIEQKEIDRVFIPSNSFVVNGFHELIDDCRQYQIKLKVIAPETHALLRMARVYDVAGVTLYSPPRQALEFAKKVIKRFFDLAASSILLLLLSPIFLVTCLAIYLESGKPIIYKQRRSSTRGGREFEFFKFRSMVPGAEKIREQLAQQNEASGALFKMRNDPRMTRVGHFIRKFSIDELPQLFNVFLGDMSLVGPRPLPSEDFEKFDLGEGFWEAIKDRDRVKPGITGLWQISGRSDTPFNEMVLLDLYYIEHQSLLFDLEILFETIPAVLFGRGAY